MNPSPIKPYYENMAIFLEIQSGPQRGYKLMALSGLEIGRSSGDLRLPDDPKVSGLHAKIEVDNKGQLILIDQNSGNGLHIEGRRVSKVALLPGVRFQIGDTQLSVSSEAALVTESQFGEDSWKGRLKKHVLGQNIHDALPESAITTFSPVLRISVIAGIQTDMEFILAYGPRSFGARTYDFILEDIEAADLCFNIVPGNSCAEIINHVDHRLKINEAPAPATAILQDGDVIRIGQTKMKVHYE